MFKFLERAFTRKPKVKPVTKLPPCQHQWRNVTGRDWIKCMNCGQVRSDFI